jgi:GntR family galactonate operon transcriptional repressor
MLTRRRDRCQDFCITYVYLACLVVQGVYQAGDTHLTRGGTATMGYPGRGLHGEIVEKIGLRIVSGQYQPNDPLYAEDLERIFGVSKTVVREAVKVLAAKGLVESRPKRGTIVRPRDAWNLLDPDLLAWQGRGAVDPAFLRDLAEVRFIVEPEAARLAATRHTEADLESLRTAVAQMRGAGHDSAAIVEADLAFHRALLGAAHNELLTRMEVVIEAGLRARDQLVHGSESWPDSITDHEAIVDAVAAGDAEGAAGAVRRQLAQASEHAEQKLGHSEDGSPQSVS